ncbi:MAG: NAD(P)H-dependent oxidoreductase [Deltaproteobacteria bacterium]|jgi:multimeric flavodoxin WrbA|nr:NAD(P)H-dependent oxidoreductase [Deltaproteobacteria bacterium]
MKIAFINGSPKPPSDKSASGLIIKALEAKLGTGVESQSTKVVGGSTEAILKTIEGADALALVFPLYVDGLPSHFARFLDANVSAIAKAAPQAKVYTVINNGYYEGCHNQAALEMVRHFALRAELSYGQGLGVGGGGMIPSVPIGFGPLKNLGKALDSLAKNILNLTAQDDITIEPNISRWLYFKMAHLSFRLKAFKNGLKSRDLYLKP